MLRILIFCWILLQTFTKADEHDHKYQEGEQIVVWSAHVGPYNNKAETYTWKQLPFCKGSAKVTHHHETLGEQLQGLQLENMGTEIRFRQSMTNVTLCQTRLSSKEINLFRYAISNNYWATVYIDDLPVYFFLGDTPNTGEVVLFTHHDYSFGYNGDQIIQVNVTSANPLRLGTDNKDLDVTFTYSISWTSDSTPFNKRFDKLLDHAFYQHSVHWFSILNSFMMVLFLTGLVSMILLRAIRRDLARYEKDSNTLDLENDLTDEFGWKQVHGDVFRPPFKLILFSSLLGTGIQLALLSFLVILSTILGSWYRERSTMLTASIFFYAMTAIFAGYTSSSYYTKYGGKEWVRNLIFTACLWPGIVVVFTLIINFIAIYYSSAKAIPFGSMIAVLAIWLFLVFPLTLFGSILGKNWTINSDFPCRVNPIPRPIPEKPWFVEPGSIVMLGGILPFGSIFIEMWFIFTSFWNYRIYYVYGFLLIVFCILLIVTSCVTIIATYFLLNSEDYRWHWVSFLTAGSTSGYVFLYSIYYYFVKTSMSGLFQTVFYFGNTALAAIGLFLMLGSVGHFAAEQFVKRIFRGVKLD